MRWRRTTHRRAFFTLSLGDAAASYCCQNLQCQFHIFEKYFHQTNLKHLCSSRGNLRYASRVDMTLEPVSLESKCQKSFEKFDHHYSNLYLPLSALPNSLPHAVQNTSTFISIPLLSILHTIIVVLTHRLHLIFNKLVQLFLGTLPISLIKKKAIFKPEWTPSFKLHTKKVKYAPGVA